MIPVAVAGGITLYCPEDGRYSFFNSPYSAHRLITGLDIYPNTTSCKCAPSPISGEILQIRHVKAPKGHGFEAPDHDTITIIGNKYFPERVVKILHVDPGAEIGDIINLGDPLGPMIRSGYFGYQTPLHAHVEVRPADDPLRVKGGFPMDSLLNLEKLEVTKTLAGIVGYKGPGYVQIELFQHSPRVIVEVGEKPAIIDGGIPLYGWFGAHVEHPKIGAPVKLLGKQIGIVRGVGPRSCVAECTAFILTLGVIPVDLFFTLTPRLQTMLIATSKKRGVLDVTVGEAVSIAVS